MPRTISVNARREREDPDAEDIQEFHCPYRRIQCLCTMEGLDTFLAGVSEPERAGAKTSELAPRRCFFVRGRNWDKTGYALRSFLASLPGLRGRGRLYAGQLPTTLQAALTQFPPAHRTFDLRQRVCALYCCGQRASSNMLAHHARSICREYALSWWRVHAGNVSDQERPSSVRMSTQ
ncbi:MAG TPA: hypothetical protein VGF67_15530 [Ktedonobacteraceae bacterium]